MTIGITAAQDKILTKTSSKNMGWSNHNSHLSIFCM